VQKNFCARTKLQSLENQNRFPRASQLLPDDLVAIQSNLRSQARPRVASCPVQPRQVVSGWLFQFNFGFVRMNEGARSGDLVSDNGAEFTSNVILYQFYIRVSC
jgi:hypothetical protein